MNDVRHKMYHTIFKEEDRIKMYYWVKISSHAEKIYTPKNIVRKALFIYRLLRRKEAKDFNPLGDMVKALYPVRIFAWTLLKAHRCMQKSLPMHGLIFNAKSIQSELNTLAKSLKQLQWIASKRVVLITKLFAVICSLIVIALFIYLVTLNAGAIATTTDQFHNGSFSTPRLIATWELTPERTFKNFVRHSLDLMIFRSSVTTVMSYYMIFFPLLALLITALTMRPIFITHEYDDIKECAEELPTYKKLLEELLKHKKPLDDSSKKILQERGILAQEIGDYYLYDSLELTDLFKKIREYSHKKSFRKAIGTKLNELCSLSEELRLRPYG